MTNEGNKDKVEGEAMPTDEEATETLAQDQGHEPDHQEPDQEESAGSDGGRVGSKNLRIAAAGVAAALVAGALFLAPGNELLGLDSSSAGMERHDGGRGDHGHDGPGEDRAGSDESDYHDFDGDGPDEGYGEDQDRSDWGSSDSAPSGPSQLGTNQS